MAEADPKTTPPPTTTTTTEDAPPSTAELMSSAKVVAGAAQSACTNQSDKIDKAKVAGAADDLLEAGKSYGKLEGTGAGQYVEKAEGYLHQMSKTDTSTTPAAPDAPSSTESGGGGGGGFGGLTNMASKLFK